jgi:hypothetical protein
VIIDGGGVLRNERIEPVEKGFRRFQRRKSELAANLVLEDRVFQLAGEGGGLGGLGICRKRGCGTN